MEERIPRRLAAILYADVVGYSRMASEDEDATHRRLKESLDLISKTVTSHHGRVINYSGDAALAMFEAVVDAVSCAAAIQRDMVRLGKDVSEEQKIRLRIGANLGDVIEDDGDIFGDGVNVAARLEELAEPGGICISESVRTAIGKKMAHDYEFMGEQQVKNIEEPVRAYRVAPVLKKKTQLASAGKPNLELPDKPSIAVLPFTSMSSDPEQEFLADGITDDIITNLSRFRDLFVIASNSSFVYKGKAVNVQDVSRELGVRYILEGSIQKSKDEIRINAQLIEGSTGSHLWAERYQRHVDDIFALQDEVVGLIVGSLATGYGGRLRKAWQRGGSDNPKAFDSFMRGMDLMENFTPEDNRRSKECFEEAIRLNPNYGKAYAKLAWVYMLDAAEGWGDNYEELMAKGLEAATRGVEVEDDESWAHWSLGACHLYALQYDLGLAEFERAIELNPNDADVLADAGYYFTYAGMAEAGAEMIYQAMRINPHYPEYYLVQLGQVLFDAHKYEEAIATFARLRNVETPISCLYLAASQAAFGNNDKAKEAIVRLLKHDPGATIGKWIQPRMSPYKNNEDAEHFGQNLRKAGLPE